MRQIKDLKYRTRGMRNNNPFNVVMTSEIWKGKVPNKENTDGKFEQFKDLNSGIRCGMIVILNYIKKHNLHTVCEIVYRFCPDNTRVSYVNNISKMSFLRSEMIIDNVAKYLVLCRCMMKIESGYDCPYSTLLAIYNVDIPKYLTFGYVETSEIFPLISEDDIVNNLTK